MLNNIRIVLVNTFHPGNIGASLRALKTMSLDELTLVSPVAFPHDEVAIMAAGAEDLIDRIKVVPSLKEAVSDCSLVIGTSARKRGSSLPLLSPEHCGKMMLKESKNSRTALVFGRERSGLNNEELGLCNYHVMIPANPEYPVLNLAQAVQILCYEIWKSAVSISCEKHELPDSTSASQPAHAQMEQFYCALEDTLFDINFIIRKHPGDIMTRLRRLFNRARPDLQELNILRGILSRVKQNASEKGK